MELDPLDLHLLQELQEDATLSNLALAAKVGASPATTLRRVKRLTDLGVIERQVAIVNLSHLGPQLQALVEVTLDKQGAEHLDAFQARAVADPQVQQVWRVSPGPDFVLVVASDITEMRALTERLGYQATHDSLTELANRREFELRLDQAIAAVDAGEGRLQPARFAGKNQWRIRAEGLFGSAERGRIGVLGYLLDRLRTPTVAVPLCRGRHERQPSVQGWVTAVI